MDLARALQTTGTVREFADHPVPDDLVHHILDVARFAPSGGNRQAWRVVVVKDRAVREKLRDLYLRGWYDYLAITEAGLVPWAPITDRAAEERALASAGRIAADAAAGSGGLAEHLDRVPALLVLLADMRSLAAVDRDHDGYTFIGGASIYPFAWSILLAANDAGVGGVLTTMLVREDKTALELLGAPAGWAIAGAIALGYPKDRRPTRLRRKDVNEFVTVDRFDGSPLKR
jgi:nitroreductase